MGEQATVLPATRGSRTICQRLGEQEVPLVVLSDGARRELAQKTDPARWDEVLAQEDVALVAGSPERVFTAQAQAPELRAAFSAAFTATIRFIKRDSG